MQGLDQSASEFNSSSDSDSDESNSESDGQFEQQESGNFHADNLDKSVEQHDPEKLLGMSQHSLLESESECTFSPLYDMSVYESPIATKPLFDGASTTLLEAVVEHLLWFSEHPGISKEALSDMLHLQHHRILPPGNVLPHSYEAALKVVEPFLIKPVAFHVCPNDCIVYRGKYTHLDQCPHCHSNRFIAGSTTVPAKRFTYLPLGPRLERMFGTQRLSEIIQSHCSRSDGRMYDIHDSKVWEQSYSPQGLFAGDLVGLHLLCALTGLIHIARIE